MRLGFIDSASRRHEDTLLAWLLGELPAAEQLLVASGYFDGSILNWIERPIADMLARGGSAHFALGSNQGMTTRADLERLFAVLSPYAPSQASLTVIHIPGAIFHPKVYFARGPGRVAALVGSPNLTTASGLVNIETALTLEASSLEPPLDAIEASIRPATIASMPNAYAIAAMTDFGRLAAMRVIDVPRTTAPRSGAGGRGRRQNQARLTRFPPGEMMQGTPAPTARPAAVVVPPPVSVPTGAPGSPAMAVVVFVFSGNDLKLTDTKEFSVPEGVRTWASNVLGAPIRPGQGDLMRVNVLARMGRTPNDVVASPSLVRLWSAGASGGTHQDVRLVLGNQVRGYLEEQSTDLFGNGLDRGDIGILELPRDPAADPLRLTVYRPADPEHSGLLAMTSRAGRQQKPQATMRSLPLLPRWPY